MPAKSLIGAALATMLASAALGQTQKQLVDLRLKGLASASPQLNSILGAEVGAPAINAKVVEARAELNRAYDTAANEPGAIRKALMADAQALQAEVSARFQSVVVTAEGSVTRKAVVLTQTSPLAIESFYAARQAFEAGARDRLFEAAALRNRVTLDAALVVELSKLNKNTLKDWASKLDARADDLKVVEAVLTASPAVLKKQLVEAAGDQAAVLLRSQLQTQLPDAIQRALKLSPSERDKLQKTFQSGLPIVLQTAGVVNALEGTHGALTQANAYLSATKNAAEGLQGVGELLVQRISSGQSLTPMQRVALKSAVQLGQEFLQGGAVSSSDVLMALDRSGLNLPNKQQLLTTLDNLSAVRKPELLAKGLKNVGAYLQLAESLGVHVDPGISEVVQKGQAAASVAMAFTSGNYFGAVQGVVGLFGGGSIGFGGGGADPAAAQRHEQVMAALAEIKELQLKTLKAIDDLSKQLTQATETILAKLDGIDDAVSYLVAVQQFNQVQRPLTLCREFVGSAKAAGFSDGYFRSYSDRKKHFDTRANAVNAGYVQCQMMLSQSLSLVNAGSAPTLPPTLWNVDEVRNARKGIVGASHSIWRYDRMQYFPMVAYTAKALDLISSANSANTEYVYKEPCTTRLIGALAAAPDSLHNVHYAKMGCGSSSGPGPQPNEGLKLLNEGFGGEFLPGGTLLDVPVNSALIGELSHYAILFQAYQPLIGGEGDLVLMPEADLATGKTLNTQRENGARVNLASALDVVNVAIGQQSLLSGIYVSAYAGNVLKEGGFGGSATGPTAELKASAVDEGCAPHKHFDGAKFQTTVCMLALHPEFARNVALHLVLSDVHSAAMTLQEYADLFDAGVATAGDVLVSFPTLHPYMVQQNTRWYIRVSSPELLSEPLLLPLPSAAALKDGTVSYPETMRSLLVARGALLQELGETVRSKASAQLWTEASRPASSFLPPAPGLPKQ